MPQDLQLSEHDLILRNVESLRAAVEEKANGKTTTKNSSALLQSSELILQKWQDFDCKNVELQCHIDFFEKAFETQQKAAFAYTTADIEKLLESNKKLESVFTSQKDELQVLHCIADELLLVCRSQDAERVKGILETTDQRWNHILCSLKGQAKFLETKLNAFYGYDASLKDFTIWLGKMEASLQYTDDMIQNALTSEGTDGVEFRKSVKSLFSEMDAHEKILESLNSTGTQIILGLKSEAREPVQAQLDSVNERWNQLKAKCEAVQRFEMKQHQDKQSKAFNLLLQKLIELDVWLKCIDDEFSSQTSSLGGDSALLNSQADHCKNLYRQLESKSSQVESYLRLGKQSLEKVPQLDSGLEDMQLLSATVGEHLTLVEAKWVAIKEKLQVQQTNISTAAKRLEDVELQLAEVKQFLDSLEESKSQWLAVDEILGVDIQAAVNQTRSFEAELVPVKVKMNLCSAAVELLKTQSVTLSQKNLSLLEDINERVCILEASVEDRLNLLMLTALKKIDPSMQHQLAITVTSPWKRAVTEGKQVPYYINHETETTQWNHPEMTNILQALTKLNDVKFSAYRTALKLRLLQRKLSFTMIHGTKLLELFKRSDFTGPNDQLMSVADVIKSLTLIFSEAETEDAKFNAPLTIDLVLNWLLNVYDNARTGQIWPMSFKIALLLMSSGSLDEKYRAIFSVAANRNGMMDEFQLSLLLQDCIQIPRQLGEAAAFGGTNVDTAVRSCFEKVNNQHGVDVSQFLNWMQFEPQSLVWIPVMHRLADTEKVLHHVSCVVCKTNPIVGVRYRCLRCFSFDMCQNCFFLGCNVKGHDLTHPMREYTTVVSSSEEMRDISKVLKNKLRSPKYHRKHPRLGYLPVEPAQGLESSESLPAPPEMTSKIPGGREIHSRLELCASRLAEIEKRNTLISEHEDEHALIGQLCQSLGGGLNHSVQLQSPMQIMMALDSDQKLELNSIMKDLEEENRALQAEYDLLRQESQNLDPKAIHDRDVDAIDGEESQDPDLEMIAEAKLLRLYKERLETRMEILEDHNSRLNSQLQRLRQLLSDQTETSNHQIIYPSKQKMTSPALSAASSQNSLPRRGPPSFASALRRSSRHALKDKEQQATQSQENNSFAAVHKVDSQQTKCENDATNDMVFEVADIGKELDSLINGLTSYVNGSAKEEMV